MLVLGIESSCDDTSASIVYGGRKILSNVISSQIDAHSKYGGVVPEIASRKHIEAIVPVISKALAEAGVSLADIEGIAVTRGPGLIGSLLVGLSAGKSVAFSRGIPFVGVNHIEGHIAAVFLSERIPVFPFVALVVSGGHTHVYIVRDYGDMTVVGQTRDDAAGEAFDKAAKMLGLGYPGGVVIDRLARVGDSKRIDFPRSMKGSLDFSFSGLKTSLFYYIRKRKEPLSDEEIPHVAASYQDDIVDVLLDRVLRVSEEWKIPRIVISGGVAANSRLRKRFHEETERLGFELFIPPPVLCTDNAAMIAAAGNELLKRGRRDSWDLNAVSRWPIKTGGSECPT